MQHDAKISSPDIRCDIRWSHIISLDCLPDNISTLISTPLEIISMARQWRYMKAASREWVFAIFIGIQIDARVWRCLGPRHGSLRPPMSSVKAMIVSRQNVSAPCLEGDNPLIAFRAVAAANCRAKWPMPMARGRLDRFYLNIDAPKWLDETEMIIVLIHFSKIRQKRRQWNENVDWLKNVALESKFRKSIRRAKKLVIRRNAL